ncbi:hypothetical protein T06_2006, partial [Trichinella sp. T6]
LWCHHAEMGRSLCCFTADVITHEHQWSIIDAHFDFAQDGVEFVTFEEGSSNCLS